jgi:hypothetical protein
MNEEEFWKSYQWNFDNFFFVIRESLWLNAENIPNKTGGNRSLKFPSDSGLPGLRTD